MEADFLSWQVIFVKK